MCVSGVIDQSWRFEDVGWYAANRVQSLAGQYLSFDLNSLGLIIDSDWLIINQQPLQIGREVMQFFRLFRPPFWSNFKDRTIGYYTLIARIQD